MRPDQMPHEATPPLADGGGPAFPVPEMLTPDGRFIQSAATGMTLRDAAALAALPAVMSDFYRYANEQGYPESWREGVALDAYMMADAMLKAREGDR